MKARYLDCLPTSKNLPAAKYLLFATVVLFSACNILKDGSNVIQVSLDEPFELRLGDVASFAEDTEITFESISDSRCPQDVVCIVAGQVDAVFGIETPNSRDTLQFSGYLHPDSDKSIERTWENYLITLDRIDPYPISTETQNSKVATLRVHAIPEE